MSNTLSLWTRALAVALVAGAMPSCTTAPPTTSPTPSPTSTDAIDTSASFLAIPREAASTSQNPRALAALSALGTEGGDFYLAINKKVLGERWFLSAFLKQQFPDPVSGELQTPATLGTRVVRFEEQNDRLYLVDAADTHKWSDVYNPELLVDAYPIVRELGSFGARPGADQFLVIDPADGLARFEMLSDAYGQYSQKFEVDLKLLRNVRALADGVAYDEVFTGTSDAVMPSRQLPSGDEWRGNEEQNLLRTSGTLGISLRRYAEGAGYTPFPMPLHPDDQDLFFRTARQLQPDQDQDLSYATKWNVHPGMKPIRWVISEAIRAAQAKYPRYDVIGAVTRGIESWNDVFGFRVLEAVVQEPGAPLTDDDVNAVIWDNDLTSYRAFADWRSNPNTGETRGASIYVATNWIASAERDFPPNAAGASSPAPRDESVGQRRLHWTALPEIAGCRYLATSANDAAPQQLSAQEQKESVERVVSHVVAHEIGHTLGLRHNFKGSLAGGAGSSVMDYVKNPLAAQSPGPLAYDRDAIRLLYGLATEAPQQAFCNDDGVAIDATCTRYDQEDHVRWALDVYAKGPRWYDTSGFEILFIYKVDATLNYLRVGVPDERLRVWQGIVAYDGLPLRHDPAWTPDEAEDARLAADYGFRTMLRGLYLTPADILLTATDLPPQDDAAFMQSFVAQAKLNLASNERTFETRRTVVDVLRKLQSVEGLDALNESRTVLDAQAASATGAEATQLRDLIKRIDVATNPYFD